MQNAEAVKAGYTVLEWCWEFHPYAAQYMESEPKTVARIARWVGWQEAVHGRTPLFRQDGTRVYDAFALGWAFERKHLDDRLSVPKKVPALTSRAVAHA